MEPQTLIVIGGVAAGMSAAAKAKREDPELSVRVYERGPHVAYGQCGLPYYLAGFVDDPASLIARTPEEFQDQGIEVFLFHEATMLDPVAKTVTVCNVKEARYETVHYDILVIATGADPVIPALPGIHLNGVESLKTIPDAEEINRFLEDDDVKEVVLVGGGYINVEMAEAVLARGKNVRIIQRPTQLLNNMDESFGEAASAELEKHGVKVHVNESAVSLEGNDRVKAVVTDKDRYPADLVIFALGIQPNTLWLHNIGLEMMSHGAVRVNAFSRTNLESVYAAGDCAGVYHRVKKREVYMPLGTTANKQGRIAGSCIAGKPEAFRGIVGTSIVKVMDLAFGKTGLTEKEAKAEKLYYRAVTVKSSSHAGSYPGSSQVTIKMVYDVHSRIILGAQMIGPQESAKRLDVLALAIHNEMIIDELALVDFCYAPPYANVWDVVQVAAKAAKD